MYPPFGPFAVYAAILRVIVRVLSGNHSKTLQLNNHLMDDIVRPPDRRASGGREFQRAYKACLSCRQKKAKCDIGAAPPCARCRREQRRCVFSEKRSWARKARTGTNVAHHASRDPGLISI